MSSWKTALGFAISTAMLAGCGTYVPDGATVVSVKNSQREFDRADLRPPANELKQSSPIPMKWYDTNTFMTTATLAPGTYSFRARNFDGGGIVEDIVVTADKNLYEIDAGIDRTGAKDQKAASAGPVVKGRVTTTLPQKHRQVTILFIGSQVVMRTVPLVADGSFSVEAPQAGRWRIEAHILGATPLSYVKPVTDVRAPLDLGTITLQ